MNKKKLLKGFSNVHFAPFENDAYITPIPIQNGKKIEAELKYESEQEWADDSIVDDEFNYAGGEGSLTTLGLDKTEYNALFNNKIVKGGIVVNSGDVAREGAFLFERKRKNSKHRRLYVIYACKCSQSGINAETIEEGKGPAGEDEIKFTVGQAENGDIFHFIDTDDPTVDQDAITNWFTTVQKPKEVANKEKSKPQKIKEDEEDGEVAEVKETKAKNK